LIGTFYVSFSYELRARIKKSELIQGSEKPEVTLFLCLTAVKFACGYMYSNSGGQMVGAAF